MQCRLGQLLNIIYQYTSCIDWLFIYLQVVSMSAVYMARTSFQTVSFNLIGWFWYWPMGGMLILSQKKNKDMYYKVKQTDPQISLVKYFLMIFGSCKQLYFTWKERDVVNTREAHLRQVQMASYVLPFFRVILYDRDTRSYFYSSGSTIQRR